MIFFFNLLTYFLCVISDLPLFCYNYTHSAILMAFSLVSSVNVYIVLDLFWFSAQANYDFKLIYNLIILFSVTIFYKIMLESSKKTKKHMKTSKIFLIKNAHENSSGINKGIAMT